MASIKMISAVLFLMAAGEAAAAKELITDNTGVGAGPYIYPKALKGILGTKFKLISGFPSISNVHLAMERNEIDAVCQPLEAVVSTRPDWIASKTVNVLFQGGERPNPQLSCLELISE